MIYEYINKLVQFDQTNYTLLISDPDHIYPSERLEKSFKSINVSAQDLDNEAQREIVVLKELSDNPQLDLSNELAALQEALVDLQVKLTLPGADNIEGIKLIQQNVSDIQDSVYKLTSQTDEVIS